MKRGYSTIFFLLAIAVAFAQQIVNEDVDIGYYESDIKLTPEQQQTLEANSNPDDPFAPQNAVVRNSRSLWPNGNIPYILDSSLSSLAISAIMDAMATYEAQTCITFTQRTTELDYVRFFRGQGCFSFIGRIGGPQDISIGNNCHFEGIVIHEIFHALGRWHEQSRPDRDQFVRILRENIQSGTENNFEITNPSFVTTQGVPYDLRSIMHYGSRAFSSNGQPTILPVDPNINERDLGQRQGLSNSDLQHVLTLYCGGGNTVGGTWSTWTAFSSCSRTCNGGTRTRTRTCVGGSDCEGSSVNTQQCNTQSCPDIVSTWGSWGSWSRCSVSCAGGRQQRIRTCLGGNTCSGIRTQFRSCNTQSCPEPATWGSWGSWGACSSTCQGGIRQRQRTCQNGNSCPGTAVEAEDCNTNTPCVRPPDPNSGEWSSWTSCSKQCGGGVRYRSRLCNTINCVTDIESCNTEECKPENLRGLLYHGCWYLNTRTGRLGTLEGRSPDLSDDPLTRVNPVGKCGLQAQIENRRYFGVALGYCISGSPLLSDYQYYMSPLCREGRGSYSQGYFIMDVYEITNAQSFADSASVDQISMTTDSGSQRTAYSLMPLLTCVLVGLIALFQ